MENNAPSIPARESELIERPKGKSGNPAWFKGMPSPRSTAAASVFQNPGDRARLLLQKHGAEQLIKWSKNIKKAPVSSFDAMLIIQMGNILVLRDGLERERLWDRMFGKVPDKQININLNLDANAEQLRTGALALLDKLS